MDQRTEPNTISTGPSSAGSKEGRWLVSQPTRGWRVMVVHQKSREAGAPHETSTPNPGVTAG